MSSVLILDKVLPVSFLSSILDNNIRRHPRGLDVQIRQKITANKNSGKWKGMGINHQRQAPTSERLFVIPPVKQSEAEYNEYTGSVYNSIQPTGVPLAKTPDLHTVKSLESQCFREKTIQS